MMQLQLNNPEVLRSLPKVFSKDFNIFKCSTTSPAITDFGHLEQKQAEQR